MTPWYMPILSCFHVKSGSCASKGVSINRREPEKSGRAWVPHPCCLGVIDPRNTPLSPTCVMHNFVVLGESVRTFIKVIGLKDSIIVSRLYRSLNVIGTDKPYPSVTCNILLTFHSNDGPIPYRFRGNGDYSRKSQICTPCIFGPAEGVRLWISHRRSGSKIRRIGLPGWETSLTISSGVYRHNTRTWRTDGHLATSTTALTHTVSR